jgi:diamine N-acetyltransferase
MYIYIRALEPNDLEFIYHRKRTNYVGVSNTNTHTVGFLVKQYLENAHQDIYEIINDWRFAKTRLSCSGIN